LGSWRCRARSGQYLIKRGVSWQRRALPPESYFRRLAGMTFQPVPEKPSFPKEEKKTLAYWEEIDAFQEALRQSKGKPEYVFYDGPPFATGLPHYGHILAGTIKDVVTRYAHQQGYHVERRFGWDCHGLPVEYEIDKKLNIKGKGDVMSMGIDRYNEECRSIVQRYTNEWREIVTRFGRWVDFDNDYKTMQPSFMESCWWVFKQLFDKGMVYRAFRVMPYSTACATALSNFEVTQNYREVSDPSIIVQFKLKETENTWFLAWTTTPWTLPSNLALCVNPNLTYLRVKKKADGHVWIVGKDRWQWVCSSIKKDAKKDFDIVEEVKGSELVGTTYIPLFDYFEGKAIKDKCWRIVSDGYVSTEAGTCIVHQAPGHGEDDNRVCLANGIILKDGSGLVCPVDENGCYLPEVRDFAGQHVKAADNGIKALLKTKGNLVFSGSEVHNYPHCYRSDTPLIYKAEASWFIKVESEREKIIACNDQTYWVPAFVKEKRFHNWLKEARDWCVSRTRFWGTPIPLWVSDDYEEIVCIGSIEELEKHAGRKLPDIHRHFIDDIKIPSKKGKGMLKRVEHVFDCWFESGSMPYASRHYPFDNKSTFESAFPAQFIAEGLDQTRGWFYTLMVLSSHLFNKPAFHNLIVNGLVLAADGKKMSKRLKNYPDPQEIVETHGADAVRMYLCNSQVVRAEPLKFQEAGVSGCIRDVFLPWFNAYRFLVQETFRYESDGSKFTPDSARIKSSTNVMDKWINASCHGLIKFVREEMEAYRLYTVVPRLLSLLEDLTNWYVRLNRDRMRGNSGREEALTSLCTLYDVLLNLCVLMAPVTPFITEMIYLNLSRALSDGHPMKCKSVHFVMIPDADTEALDPEITQAISRMQSVVELGRTCREHKKVTLKRPLRSMVVMNKDPSFIKDVQNLSKYLEEELNVVKIDFREDAEQVTWSATLNFKALGKKLGKDMKAVKEAVENLPQKELATFHQEGKITVCGHEITSDEMELGRKVQELGDPNLGSHSDDNTTVILDFTYDEDLAMMETSRDIVNRVQKLRKDAKLQQSDPVDMWVTVVDGPKSAGWLRKVLGTKKEYINKLLRRTLWSADMLQGHEVVVKSDDFEIDESGDKIRVTLTSTSPFFNTEALRLLTGGDAQAELCARQFVQTCDLKKLVEGGPLKMTYGGRTLELKRKEHWALGPTDAPWVAA